MKIPVTMILWLVKVAFSGIRLAVKAWQLPKHKKRMEYDAKEKHVSEEENGDKAEI